MPVEPDSQPSSALSRTHVLVVGAGGLGCPAAWALAEAGVGRLTLFDGDTIATSNLPRQILYRSEDVGRPKALVAAERLAGLPSTVQGRAEMLDHENAPAALADVDLVVDATDGARVKDWLNALAVRMRLPLVHAAALRSEGRLLTIPAGGRPCLACLFGRLEDDLGSCADHGVWGGVVGATGFLAAAAVLRALHAAPGSSAPPASEGYAVLDLEGGRALTLAVAASPACPVCGPGAPRVQEPYPQPRACAVTPALGEEHVPSPLLLDLRDEECPMNLLRARRGVEELPEAGVLTILLGAEGSASVPDGVRALGHDVLEEVPNGEGLRLVVRRGLGGERRQPALGRDDLLRYARQVVMPEVGEAGQQRILDACVALGGSGPIHQTAAIYLVAAGVGRIELLREAPAQDGDPVLRARVDDQGIGRITGRARPRAWASGGTGPSARALGALLADSILRAIVTGRPSPPAFGLQADGTIVEEGPTP